MWFCGNILNNILHAVDSPLNDLSLEKFYSDWTKEIKAGAEQVSEVLINNNTYMKQSRVVKLSMIVVKDSTTCVKILRKPFHF